MLPVTLAILAMHAPVPKPGTPIQIDLSSVYSTVKMKEVKRINAEKEVDLDHVNSIKDVAGKVGLSTALLVSGEGIGEVVSTTRLVFGNGKGGDVICANEKKVSKEIWICIFLGNDSSSPPAYEINYIELSARTIRVGYERPDNIGSTADVVPYLVWAKLGQLDPGAYQLELFDKADKSDRPAMSRKVVIK